MAGYQYCVIVGNVGRDPELRYLQSGAAVCSFSVAVTERWKDRQSDEMREKTEWFRVSCWNRLAETVNQYVYKGMQIMVAGSVSTSAYTNQAGEPQASLEMRARDVQFLGSRGERADGGGQQRGGYDEFAPPPEDMEDIPF